ncbi:MAG TPA: pyridoxal 5'-phosphate synthase [Solirubrobacteraceae bacterium]|nr:pyridoxal 5'-phosphate synthase [Solirubrobacteraceae bacterium]
MSASNQADKHPLRLLEQWLADAREAGVAEHDAVALATVGANGQPSTRIVQLKRVEADALIFTSALWTRKAREISANPLVSLLAYWPTLGRQAHICGEAVLTERELSVELFAGRALERQLQAVVSRQGEPIESLEELRDRHAHLMQVTEAPPDCPPDWGAIRIAPTLVELWSESADRMHDRLLYERVERSWRCTRIAP